jgi:hypothetical protein
VGGRRHRRPPAACRPDRGVLQPDRGRLAAAFALGGLIPARSPGEFQSLPAPPSASTYALPLPPAYASTSARDARAGAARTEQWVRGHRGQPAAAFGGLIPARFSGESPSLPAPPLPIPVLCLRLLTTPLTLLAMRGRQAHRRQSCGWEASLPASCAVAVLCRVQTTRTHACRHACTHARTHIMHTHTNTCTVCSVAVKHGVRSAAFYPSRSRSLAPCGPR